MQLARTVILQWSLKKWACSHAFDFIKIWCLWAEWSFQVHQFFEHSFVCQVLWHDMPAQSFTESGCACRYSNDCTNSISHSHSWMYRHFWTKFVMPTTSRPGVHHLITWKSWRRLNWRWDMNSCADFYLFCGSMAWIWANKSSTVHLSAIWHKCCYQQDIKYADWSKNVTPFWPAVMASALSFRGLIKLATSGNWW